MSPGDHRRHTFIIAVGILLMMATSLLSTVSALEQQSVETQTTLQDSGSLQNVSTYGVGLTGAPVILDEPTLSSMTGGPMTVAAFETLIQEYFVPSAIKFVFLDIGWDGDANTSTTQVAGGYEPWVNNWLYASNQFGIENIFFTKQWGEFFSTPSWDQDVLNEYPSVATVNGSGVDVPLMNCAGCQHSSGWTDASPLIYRAYEADLKQLYAWYGNYTNWIGFGEGSTGDINNYGSASGGIAAARPFDNFTMSVYANSVFFQRVINPTNGEYLSNGQVSKIWAMFVNDERDVVMSNGPPLVYPQANAIYGGGKAGYVLLQRFYVPFGESVSDFTIKSYAGKVGSPTGSLYLSILADNSSNANGHPLLRNVLANQTVTGLRSSLVWVSTAFAGVRLLGGDYYWAAYTTSTSGTSRWNYFSVVSDQQNVFPDVYTFSASNGLSHATRNIGGSVLWLQSSTSSTITVYPYLNQGPNQPGGTAYFEVSSIMKANVITFFVSDRAYDPNNITLSLENPGGTVLATATFSVHSEYGVGTLSYLPLQLSTTVTLTPGIEYSLVASSLTRDNYVGSSGGGVTQDYLTETANPPCAGYLGQATWPIFQLDYMILQPNGVSNYNYLGGVDLMVSPGYVAGSEIALRFKASSTETLSEFQVELIGVGSSSASLQLSLRSDNTTQSSHPESLKSGAALATSSVTLSSLSSAMRSGPTTSGYYVLANFTSFKGSTSLTAGTYYWLVLNATKNSKITLQRLVEPEHLVYYSANDYDKTWSPCGDGPTDLSFRLVTNVQTINNIVIGHDRISLSYFAQSFESPRAIQLIGVWADANSGGDNVILSIHPDSGSDSPSSKVLAFGTISQNSTGGSLNYAKLNFPVNIKASKKYWIVLQSTSCISSCSEGASVSYNVYSPLTHSSSVDYGGTALHYETSSNGVTWTSPVLSSEGDMPFILATSVSTIKTYNTKTLYEEIVADDAQATSYTPKGWNQFLDYEQAQINYNLTQMMNALSGRTFQWFTGLDPNVIESLPRFNSQYVLTQALGAGGGFECVSNPKCGGVKDYWNGDTTDKLGSILSSLDQSNVIGWSSFGSVGDNVGGLTLEDVSQQYLIELPQLASSSILTANDWSWGLSLHGLDNFTQTAPMRAFGTLLNRMVYSGGYFGTSTSTVKALWIENSGDGAVPAYLESAVNIRLDSESDSNLTQFGNLHQFNVIIDPSNIESITASAEARIIAFVKAGGGIVEDSPPAAWEDQIMGLSPVSSGCCTAPYRVLADNEITKPYALLPGYAPYWAASFTRMVGESATFDVTDANGYPVVSSNNYYSGRGVFVSMDAARLQYDSFGDSYMTLLMNGILYAAHQDSKIPVVWTTTYAPAQSWKGILYTIDGSVGRPLLWISSNSTSSQTFSLNLNALSFGITTPWVAINMQDMSVVASGSGPDIDIRATVKAFNWLPIYILSAASNLNVMYSTLSVKSELNNGQTGTYRVQGERDSSGWMIVKSTSSVSSVSSSVTGTLPRQMSLSALNQTKIGTFCAAVSSSPRGKCTHFASYSQEGWYYDPVDHLLYIHFRGSPSVTLTVRED